MNQRIHSSANTSAVFRDGGDLPDDSEWILCCLVVVHGSGCCLVLITDCMCRCREALQGLWLVGRICSTGLCNGSVSLPKMSNAAKRPLGWQERERWSIFNLFPTCPQHHLQHSLLSDSQHRISPQSSSYLSSTSYAVSQAWSLESVISPSLILSRRLIILIKSSATGGSGTASHLWTFQCKSLVDTAGSGNLMGIGRQMLKYTWKCFNIYLLWHRRVSRTSSYSPKEAKTLGACINCGAQVHSAFGCFSDKRGCISTAGHLPVSGQGKPRSDRHCICPKPMFTCRCSLIVSLCAWHKSKTVLDIHDSGALSP